MSSIIRYDKIRTLETGYNPAATNMAIDEALMETVGEVLILRIYE